MKKPLKLISWTVICMILSTNLAFAGAIWPFPWPPKKPPKVPEIAIETGAAPLVLVGGILLICSERLRKRKA